MKNIYWIAGWYPNLLEPLTGDFVERHALAASEKNDITVSFVRKDHLGLTSEDVHTEARQYSSHCKAFITYYKVPFSHIKVLHGILSRLRFIYLHICVFRKYLAVSGKPELVHVHVSMQAGIIGLLIRIFYGVPYLVTEHWTGFCPEAKPNYKKQPWLNKFIWRLVMRYSCGIIAVSKYLGESLRKIAYLPQLNIIPNVVDTNTFQPVEKRPGRHFRFVHISSMHYQKNPGAIIDAVHLLAKKRRDFSMEIYGPRNETIVQLVNSKGLQGTVRFHGEVLHPQLAQELAQYDALLLYSRFETFGCVIIEANACGLPVIVSDLTVMHEIVTEGINGIFAGNDNPHLLSERMDWMIDHAHVFNKRKIASDTASRFSFPVVGALFDALYQDAAGT